MRTISITLTSMPLGMIISDGLMHGNYYHVILALVSFLGFVGFIHFSYRDTIKLIKKLKQ